MGRRDRLTELAFTQKVSDNVFPKRLRLRSQLGQAGFNEAWTFQPGKPAHPLRSSNFSYTNVPDLRLASD